MQSSRRVLIPSKQEKYILLIALDDLREIYVYIANELLVPETAAAQVGRI